MSYKFTSLSLVITSTKAAN